MTHSSVRAMPGLPVTAWASFAPPQIILRLYCFGPGLRPSARPGYRRLIAASKRCRNCPNTGNPKAMTIDKGKQDIRQSVEPGSFVVRQRSTEQRVHRTPRDVQPLHTTKNLNNAYACLSPLSADRTTGRAGASSHPVKVMDMTYGTALQHQSQATVSAIGCISDRGIRPAG